MISGADWETPLCSSFHLCTAQLNHTVEHNLHKYCFFFGSVLLILEEGRNQTQDNVQRLIYFHCDHCYFMAILWFEVEIDPDLDTLETSKFSLPMQPRCLPRSVDFMALI